MVGQTTVLEGMITRIEAIPPHLSLIDHPIMTQKESKVIVMIALGSLFFGDLRSKKRLFGLRFFIFWGILELQAPPLRHCSHGQDWADKWARIGGENIKKLFCKTGIVIQTRGPRYVIRALGPWFVCV